MSSETSALGRSLPKELRWMLRRCAPAAHPTQLISTLRVRLWHWRRFWHSYRRYVAMSAPGESPALEHLYPCLGEDSRITYIEPTYFYQDAWAFEHIVRQRPDAHVDVGSHHKFVALLSKVVAVTMIDIRPLSLHMDSIVFREGTILNLPFDDGALPSVSSLCVVEHVGLGRYGDPLDPRGTECAITELKRVTAPGGLLYLSIPVDDVNRTYFNAHRAFTREYLLTLFAPFELIEERYIYGTQFVDRLQHGFGVGCFLLRRSHVAPPAKE